MQLFPYAGIREPDVTELLEYKLVQEGYGLSDALAFSQGKIRLHHDKPVNDAGLHRRDKIFRPVNIYKDDLRLRLQPGL